MESGGSIASLCEDVLLHVFTFIADASELVRAMTVCKAWRDAASQACHVTASIPNVPLSYEGKVNAIRDRLKAFPRLTSAHVSIGMPRERIDDTLRRCMRYAEVGSAVDKFLFLAAKTGDNDIFFDASDAEILTEALQGSEPASSTDAANISTCEQNEPSASVPNYLPQVVLPQPQAQLYLPLRAVVGPTDHSLRTMMPVIVFAIIRGFDELVQCLPGLAQEDPTLQNLLIVDRTDNVTLNIRPHHFEQLRRNPPASESLRTLVERFSDKSVLSDLDPFRPTSAAGLNGEDPTIGGLTGDKGLKGLGDSQAAESCVAMTAEAPTSNGGDSESMSDVSWPPVVAGEAPASLAGDEHQPMNRIGGVQASGQSRRRDYSAAGLDAESSEIVESVHVSTRMRERREARMLELSSSPNFDVSFWRADEAVVSQRRVRDMSVCVASNSSVPLSEAELEVVGRGAFGGPILEATMRFVNRRRGEIFL